MRTVLKALLVATPLVWGAGFTPAHAADEDDNPDLSKLGEKEYYENCAVCHGRGGKGDGPVVQYFGAGGYKHRLFPDLTQLSKNNEGVFPYQRVYQVIDGRADVAAHGPREMPVWGSEYTRESGKYFAGHRRPWDGAAYVRTRILALIEFIANMQER